MLYHCLIYIDVLKISFTSTLEPTTPTSTSTSTKRTTVPEEGTSSGDVTDGGVTHPDGTQSTEITTSVDGMDTSTAIDIIANLV